MTTTATVMMILICGLVWGGFVSLLFRAAKSEGRKRARGRD
ncbi:MAG: MetS family NSS transporter small subunit [bacterium]|nr:MetS family NSS transporter small subunit [bacterium]